MKRILLFALLPVMATSITGCSLVACDRVFPHPAWYWSAEAKRCRESHRVGEQQAKEWAADKKSTNPKSP